MNWLKNLLGYKYLFNTNTGEVHFVQKMGKRCGFIDKVNRKLITKKRFKKLRGSWYHGKVINGCRWCNRENDLG